MTKYICLQIHNKVDLHEVAVHLSLNGYDAGVDMLHNRVFVTEDNICEVETILEDSGAEWTIERGSKKSPLKTCPICKGAAKFVVTDKVENIPLGYIYCTECGLQLGQNNLTEQLAADKWNMRVPIDNIKSNLMAKHDKAQSEYSASYIGGYVHDFADGKEVAYSDALDVIDAEDQ